VHAQHTINYKHAFEVFKYGRAYKRSALNYVRELLGPSTSCTPHPSSHFLGLESILFLSHRPTPHNSIVAGVFMGIIRTLSFLYISLPRSLTTRGKIKLLKRQSYQETSSKSTSMNLIMTLNVNLNCTPIHRAT